MRRWLSLTLWLVLLPIMASATGNLTIPHTIFTQPGGTNVAPLLDQNNAAIASYINTRQITFDVLANRPLASTAGRYFFATDQNGGTLYADNGTAWVTMAAPVGSGLVNQRASLTLANTTGSTSSLSVNPGAVSSDDATLSARVLITLAVTTTKVLTAAWTPSTIAGVLQANTGCLDTGSVAVFTWYHIFLITRLDTGLVDVLCSLSATAPTMPTNYTKKQRLGAVRTTWFATPGAEIYPFTQVRNRFRWATLTHTVDVNNVTPGTGAVTASLSVPNGVPVKALMNLALANTGVLYVSELSASDEAAGGGTASCGASAGGAVSCQAAVVTNTSQSIRYRNAANVQTIIVTYGWEELWE